MAGVSVGHGVGDFYNMHGLGNLDFFNIVIKKISMKDDALTVGLPAMAQETNCNAVVVQHDGGVHFTKLALHDGKHDGKTCEASWRGSRGTNPSKEPATKCWQWPRSGHWRRQFQMQRWDVLTRA